MLSYGDSAGAVYAEVVRDQLTGELDRKESFEQRGITVVTTSGVLVSLLFGFAALGASGPIPIDATTPLLLALGAFSLAAIFGLATNIPRPYEELEISALQRLVEKTWWEAAPSDGARRVAEARLVALGSARQRNTQKGNLLMTAIALEVLAVAALSTSVRLILVR